MGAGKEKMMKLIQIILAILLWLLSSVFPFAANPGDRPAAVLEALSPAPAVTAAPTPVPAQPRPGGGSVSPGESGDIVLPPL